MATHRTDPAPDGQLDGRLDGHADGHADGRRTREIEPARPTAMTDRDRDELTGLFKLLSDGTRLDILMLLTAGERNVTSLCQELGLPQPTVSHHLGLLRMSNVIANRRSGKQVFYSLNGKVDRPHSGHLVIQFENHTVAISERRRRADHDGHADGDGRDGHDGRRR